MNIMKFSLSIVTALLLFNMCVLAADQDNSYYTVEVAINVKSAIKRPVLEVCQVYGNKDITFSMRWDDNNQANFKMQKLMHKYGFKGTFYLNAKPFDFKRICEKGTDIGAHSMSHSRLTNLNTNRIFQEVAEIRPYLESRSDKPVNSYCFAYGNYRDKANPNIGFDIAEMLQRVGYCHNAYLGFINEFTRDIDPVSGFMQISPGDRTPSSARFDNILKHYMRNQYWKRDNPNVSIGVHVWMKTPKAWGAMERIFKKYSNRPDWWYCTQTDYAAYRKMFQLAQISGPRIKKRHLIYRVTLPYASDIGSDQPLTMSFNAVATNVTINGRPVKIRTDKGKTYFNIAPPVYAKVPKLIGYTPNPDNKPEPAFGKKTDIKAWLYLQDDNLLTLTLKNGGREILTNIRIKYILPLMYKYESDDKVIGMVPGAEKEIARKLRLGVFASDRAGSPFILSQIDYLKHGKPERTFASVTGKSFIPPANHKFRDQVVVSSPFGDIKTYRVKVIAMSKPDAEPIPELKWYCSVIEERLSFPDEIAGPAARMSPDERKVDRRKPYIIFDYKFNSEKAGTLDFLGADYVFRNIPLFCVNGQEMTSKDEKLSFPIEKGLNRIVFIYKCNWSIPSSLAFPYVIK